MQLAALVAMAAVAIADVPVMPDTYTILCEGEQSAGFNWENGEWVQSTFRPVKTLITKRSSGACGDFDTVTVERLGSIDFFRRGACLNVGKFGADAEASQSIKCSESYLFLKGQWHNTFTCDGLFERITGRFNGRYQATYFHHDTSDAPVFRMKDSIFVSVGRCSKIS